jgi:hypothetical protein
MRRPRGCCGGAVLYRLLTGREQPVPTRRGDSLPPLTPREVPIAPSQVSVAPSGSLRAGFSLTLDAGTVPSESRYMLRPVRKARFLSSSLALRIRCPRFFANDLNVMARWKCTSNSSADLAARAARKAFAADRRNSSSLRPIRLTSTVEQRSTRLFTFKRPYPLVPDNWTLKSNEDAENWVVGAFRRLHLHRY